MSEDAGLLGVVPRAKGGGEFIATRFRELSRFLDSLGVIGEGGTGDLKVVLAGPRTRGVIPPRACSDAGVGGKRAMPFWGGPHRFRAGDKISSGPQVGGLAT